MFSGELKVNRLVPILFLNVGLISLITRIFENRVNVGKQHLFLSNYY